MLRVLTYNIHHAEGNDGLLDPARIAAVLRESEADVIGLNEVHHPWSATGGTPLLAEIAESLGMRYIFGAALPDLPGSSFHAPYGNAILSRFPFRNGATFRLPAPEGRESRGVAAAEIEIGNTRLWCYVTHLDHRSEQVRQERLRHLLQVIAQAHRQPHLLMGDFNAIAPDDATGEPLPAAQGKPQIVSMLRDAGYLDAQAAVGDVTHKTWSTAMPIIRIDYVWLSPELRPALRSCARWDTPLSRVASDHFPLLATLEL